AEMKPMEKTMTTSDNKAKTGARGQLHVVKGQHVVVDGQHRVQAIEHVLDEYDATALVGLRTTVHDAAIERVEEAGETTIEVPCLREMLAAAAMKRCLTPIRLRGHE